MTRIVSTRAFAVSGSVLAAVLVAEVVLRVLGPAGEPTGEGGMWRGLLHRPSEVPGLSYELTPGGEGRHRGVAVRINSYGMRGREPAPRGTPDLVRIAVVGDSNTFGFAVEADQAYPAVLEKLLNDLTSEGSPGIEVLNFGVGGYSTRDEVAVLRHRVLAWDPALVVLGYALNDVDDRGLQPLHRHFGKPSWWERSRVLEVVARATGMDGGDEIEAGLRDLYAEDAWAGVVEGFTEIDRATRERGVPCLVVIFPRLFQLGKPEYASRDLHEQVAEAARSSGLAVLDLLDAYAEHPQARLMNPMDAAHPSVFGHRVAAEAIRDRLLRDSSLMGARTRAR